MTLLGLYVQQVMTLLLTLGGPLVQVMTLLPGVPTR